MVKAATPPCINCINCVRVKFGRYNFEYGCDADTNKDHSIDIIRFPMAEKGQCKAFSLVNDPRTPTVDYIKEKRMVTHEAM